MALTLNLDIVKNPFLSQNIKGTVGRVTGPASYDDTNGEALVAQDLKLGAIAALFVEPAVTGGVLYTGLYDISNGVIRWYVSSTGSETAGAVDLSGLTARFLAIGT